MSGRLRYIWTVKELEFCGLVFPCSLNGFRHKELNYPKDPWKWVQEGDLVIWPGEDGLSYFQPIEDLLTPVGHDDFLVDENCRTLGRSECLSILAEAEHDFRSDLVMQKFVGGLSNIRRVYDEMPLIISDRNFRIGIADSMKAYLEFLKGEPS